MPKCHVGFVVGIPIHPFNGLQFLTDRIMVMHFENAISTPRVGLLYVQDCFFLGSLTDVRLKLWVKGHDYYRRSPVALAVFVNQMEFLQLSNRSVFLIRNRLRSYNL